MTDMREKVLMWLATGRVGASSKTMALCAVDLPQDRWGVNYPLDPDDLNRCLLLLDAVPEIRDHMGKIADLSPTWKRLVAQWDEIEKSFLDEVGFNWCNGKRAERTYRLMQSIIERKE